jgi:hypothetical protein
MAGEGTGRAEECLLSVVVTISGGNPDKEDVCVKRNGTVQFLNTDPVGYMVRLWTREHTLAGPDATKGEHNDVDLLLPAFGELTILVDEETPSGGRCVYELFDINLREWKERAHVLYEAARSAAKTASATEAMTESGKASAPPAPPKTGAGGGTPPPPPYQPNQAGGGTIRVG